MGKFDPFIPLAKQIVNKVKRSDSGLTIPDWYQARQVPTRLINRDTNPLSFLGVKTR